jgi:hypothetical protein
MIFNDKIRVVLEPESYGIKTITSLETNEKAELNEKFVKYSGRNTHS